MNIVFNKCIFAYLCLFYSSTKYFHEFQSIFVNFHFTDIFVKISTDISNISVKSKYRYIRNYRYFVPWLYNEYNMMKSAKELLESLDKKYKTKDAGTKKFVIGRFMDYKMVDSKTVVSQVQDIQVILHEIHS